MTKKQLKITIREDRLRRTVDNLLWMAARYAHGRHTPAPEEVRDAVKTMHSLFPDWKPQQDKVIEKPTHQEIQESLGNGHYFLDDIFNYD